jgi:hypothetical protein
MAQVLGESGRYVSQEAVRNLDLPTFIFMRSSTWPDEIRRRESLNLIF